ncbi:unnamed protein product [Calypogeia fissa]
MGGAQSSSSNLSAAEEEDRKELESKLRGTGDLAILDRAFSTLTASSSSGKNPTIPAHSLQAVFSLAPISIDDATHPDLAQVLPQIGPAIVKEFFDTENKEEIDWVQLLQGFHKCSQTTGGNGLKLLFSVFSQATQLTKGPSEPKVLEKAPADSGSYFDMVGYLTGAQLRDFFWLCWLLMCSSRLPRIIGTSKMEAFLPKLDSLLSGAVSACDISKSKEVSSEESGLQKELPIMEIQQWALSTISTLGDCLLTYIRAKLDRVTSKVQDPVGDKASEPTTAESSSQENPGKSNGKVDTENMPDEHKLLLQSGVAWAIGLSLRDTAAEILYTASCGLTSSPECEYPNLLYRSSVNGRGMNRFWTCVQGYGGLTLFLVSASTTDEASSGTTQGQGFTLGALVPGGFTNKESFYGASGSCLFSLDPVFLPMRSIGREKNFVYSHKNAPGQAYRAQPKPQGIGFGGSSSKERIWLDEEFGTLLVRHHAVDKTYQAGSLVPNQGYGPTSAKIVDIEVWGLGGKHADEEQARFLNREHLFTEQRRKVDLKTMFGTWANSPEKQMLDMVSNPNAPQREER